MAIYICGKCEFCFERAGIVDACPNCGHKFIRNATEEEMLEYKRNRAGTEKNNGREKP